MRLLIATTNRHKVREIRELLSVPAPDPAQDLRRAQSQRVAQDSGVAPESSPRLHLVTLAAWPGLAAPEETGRTFEENARQKAFFYAKATGELTVAEDSGLEIDALGGAPGVESARFVSAETSYPDKFAVLYEALRAKGTGGLDASARFVCALALVRADCVLFETRGTVEGHLAPAPKGHAGFGYDPIFFYPPYQRTFGEASQAQKSAVSHRGQAFLRLRDFLRLFASEQLPSQHWDRR